MENKKISSKILGSLLLLALACLMPMTMMAQQTHWTPVSAPYEDNMTLTGVIQINGTEQATTTLEVGAFCGTECRGAVRAVLFPAEQRYVVMLTIFGNDGDQITFKLYDHNQGTELNYQSPVAVTFGPNGLGSLMDPYVLNFTSPSYTISASASPNEGGTVSGAGSYQQGANCTLTATPATGYTFVRWTRNGSQVSTNASYSFTVTENASYVAVFSLNSYTISASASPSDGGTVTGAGSYQQGSTCTVSATANAGYTFDNWTENGTVVSTAATYTFEVTANHTLVANFVDATGTGKLSGVFSVGEHTHIQFSQGNLQYQASTNTWRFATNQYDYIGSENSNISETYSGWIDLFGWGTSGYNHGANSYQPWSTSTNNSDYYAYGSDTCNLYDQTGQADWGYNAISNGGNTTNEWRTLTRPEWAYIIYNRSTTSGIRFAKAQVTGVNGVVLLPDDWDVSYYELNSTNSDGASFSSNIITAQQWSTLEQHGAVFLPAAGGRSGTSVYNAGSYGYYWSAMYYDSDHARLVFFRVDDLKTGNWSSRYYGLSVRLVCPAENCSYSINATSNPAEGGSVSGGGNYQEGATCTLTATPAAGYTFTNWTENGEVVSTEATYSFTVTGDRNLVANFALQSYSISASASPSQGGTLSGMGSYQQGSTCTVSATANTGYTFENWTENGTVVSTAASYTFEVTASRTLVANFTDATGTGKLSGVFSVGEHTHIQFSQGNLQYQASTNTWRFATNQYDCIGSANSNISQSYSGWIDLFGWGTSGYNHGAVCYQPWNTSSIESDYYAYGQSTYNLYDQTGQADWGYNAIINGGNTENNGWRTLTGGSGGEWDYVFNTRTTPSGIRYAMARVNGVRGVILLPDDWSASYYELSSTNAEASCSTNDITAQQWNTLEQHGAVFLPAAGDRSGTSVNDVGSSGCYWSASYGDRYSARFVYILDGGLGTANWGTRYTGRSVRLVCPAENYSFGINASPNPAEGGVVSGGGNYQEGASCTLTATPSEGYTFVNWTENGEVVSTEATYSFTVIEDRTLVANFALQSYTISASASPSAGGTVSGGGTYNYGSTCNLIATPATGYTFVNWTENGEVVSTEATYSFTVIEDRTLVANFELDNLPVVSDGLVAYYPFDGDVNDYSGNENHGSISGNGLQPTTDRFGNENGAYLFGGYNNRGWISVANSNSLVFDNAMSMSFWMNLTDYGGMDGWGNYSENGNFAVLCKQGDRNGFNTCVNKYDVDHMQVYSFNSNSSYDIHAYPSYSPGQWIHCVVTVEDDLSKIYINGVLEQDSIKNQVDFSNANGVSMYIGIMNGSWYPFNGKLDDVALYNRALTPQEVKLLYSYDEDLVAYYPFDGDANDYSGNDYHATPQNNYQYESGIVEESIAVVGQGYTSPTGGHVLLPQYEFDASDGFTLTLWVKALGLSHSDGETYINIGNHTNADGVYILQNLDSIQFTYHEKHISIPYLENYTDNWVMYTMTCGSDGMLRAYVNGSGVGEKDVVYDGQLNTAYAGLGRHWWYSGNTSSTRFTGSFDEVRIYRRPLTSEEVQALYFYESNERTITVLAEPNEGGTVTGGGIYMIGDTCTVMATPNENNTFMYWSENGQQVSTDANYSFTVLRNRELVAHFTLPLTISATVDPAEGGTVTGTGEYNYNTTCTLTASPNEGYTFMYWTENGQQVSTNAHYSFTVTADRELVAHFTLPLTISATADPAEGGTVSGAGEYDYNTTCTLTATPNPGYLFLNWSKNGSLVSSNATYSFTVIEDAEFEAVFTELNGFNIGEGEATNVYLPSYSFYNYTLSQQIYTPEEIGGSNSINSIAFFNAGGTKTRNYDVYLVHTDKTSFESNTDWITVSETDRVFSGDLTFTTGQWTTINLNTPFAFDGTSNLAIIVDDNSGNWSGNPMACRVFNANGNQAIRVYSDNTNYDPYNPSSYGGTLHNVKNQVIFGMSHYTITAAASDAGMGTVAGGGQYDTGSTCTLTANATAGNFFTSWTENGVIVSTEPTYTFTVTRNRNLVANFSTNQWVPVGGNQYNMTVTGIITINGVEQTSTLLEVGAFCGEQCRASEFAQYFVPTQQYVVTLTIRSQSVSGENITFRLYDHLQGRELDEYQCINTITFQNDATIGSIDNWFQFAFNSLVDVSATVNPEGAGAVSGTGTYPIGKTVTLMAEANEGYAFRDWSVNGAVVSTASEYTFVVTDAVQLDANFNHVHTQDLVAGWNWWSTWIETSGSQGLEMLENTLGSNGLFIKSQGQSVQNYYSQTGYDYWFGALQGLDIAKGYKISVSETAPISMVGMMADPSAHPVTIAPEWNWIGYPVSTSQNLSTALTGFTPEANDMFKSQGKTSVYYEDYGWFPDMVLQPGNSYLYKSNAGENKTLTYTIGRAVNNDGAQEHHWQPITGNQYNMTVTGVIVIDGVEQQSTTLEVGAFCGDECRGSEFAMYFPLTQQYIVTLTVLSNNASGENITFRLYDHDTETEPYGVSPNAITFETDAIVGSMNNWYQFAFVSPSQTISTELAQGWTWFAPTVQTSIEAIQTALGSAYVQILAKNGTPSGDIVPGEMYRIQSNVPCTLAVTGAPITTATITINHGENWFGFVGTAKTVAAAFAGFTPAEGDKVVSQNEGFAIYEDGAWVGTLGTLQPGKGYVYVSKDAGTKTLTL